MEEMENEVPPLIINCDNEDSSDMSDLATELP